ncbi:hypothetical protein VNO78_16360 [Psophocarpus tetragonolobus]|uniref:Uncharacterized protein n=1 Tax=Psophocarpus tetragonolobus TaxID=3891 RepID=A0AAN9XKF2_PSOTE
MTSMIVKHLIVPTGTVAPLREPHIEHQYLAILGAAHHTITGTLNGAFINVDYLRHVHCVSGEHEEREDKCEFLYVKNHNHDEHANHKGQRSKEEEEETRESGSRRSRRVSPLRLSCF